MEVSMGKLKEKLNGVGPGSYSCHEALHMAAFIMNTIDQELVDHPAIAANEEWHVMARTAADKISELYQAIGRAHL